ncbi:50S ribosomal protein L4 [Candidatus Uhrbacteria bacterium]|nr:MAG: 50S ribosomal protein L4 [Candidatus Uhrbacteria bacterium]
MPNVSIYSQDGKSVGEMSLPEAYFGVKAKPKLVHEVLVAQQANRRKAVAHTKNRGEVSGGGKKPWKQKGTGRARQGSIRSPQWVGGGIVFGPRAERNFSVKVNRKAKQKALFMALSDKVANKSLLVIESSGPGVQRAPYAHGAESAQCETRHGAVGEPRGRAQVSLGGVPEGRGSGV